MTSNLLIVSGISGMIFPVGHKTPNDRQANLRHSQALESIGLPHTEFFSTAPAVYPEFGSRAESQRKAPDLWAHLCRPLSLRLSVRLCFYSIGRIIMIYTYLIASKANGAKFSDLKRIRTKSVFASSEEKARNALSGLPIVFISRVPIQEERSI